ncbi:hypothetical protein BDA99DRAFT_492877 [Phascolomyces articulosus]|uniref:DUF7082 domain-containing protein n=1 Tax=Phascolomyces articulosus TaxID=60185 RepID=A0AAD5KCB3_9FUNG|nr:hypothetical protein BDA99DRAFT_492877 [Phascolomyces articulosus]
MSNVTQQEQTNGRQQQQRFSFLPQRQGAQTSSSLSSDHHRRYLKKRETRSKKPRLNMRDVTWQNYVPYPKIDQPVQFKFLSDFNLLALNWSVEETLSHRRLVQFWPVFHPSSFTESSCLLNTTNDENEEDTIHCVFRVLSQESYHEYRGLNNHEDETTRRMYQQQQKDKSVIISCIAFRQELWITSADLIRILECIMRITLTTQEKNRVRRNLEGFYPVTASKYCEDTVDLFYHVMDFSDPIPRSIEKDVSFFFLYFF